MLPFIAFLVSCFAVNEAYLYAFKTMEVSSVKFCALSEARQFYVLKNLIKAYYLAVLVVIGALFALFPIFLYGRYDNRSIRILASLYVSNDFVGLWRVEKLATTTRLHHMTSFVFLLRPGLRLCCGLLLLRLGLRLCCGSCCDLDFVCVAVSAAL